MPVLSKPDSCRPCPLWSASEYGPGQGFSSLEGYGGSGLFAVAEALGSHEEDDGLPLRRAGASGLIFRRALDELGIDSQTLTITNVLRCFPGDTVVRAPLDEVEKIYRRWYEGELIQITTSEGVLAGTPNHPILTSKGWVPLGQLKKGSYVFSGSLTGRVSVSYPDIDHKPVRLDKLFDSLSQPSIAQRVVGSNVDFHGDGRNSQVDVIAHHSKLRDRLQPFLSQKQHQVALERASFDLGLLVSKSAGHSTLLHLFGGYGASATSLMRSSGERFSFVRSGLLEPQPHSFRAMADGNTHLPESVSEPSLPDPVFLCQGFEGFSGQVSLSEVLHVDRFSFSGHVYNLQTVTGQYTANGHIVSNCRPPNNELWGKPYTYTAINHCRPYLTADINQRRPTMFLALGDTPYSELTADYAGSLSEVRGFVLPSRYNAPLIATYHPAYITRGAWHLYGAFKNDIGRAYEFAVNGVPAPLETNYVLHPEISDVRAFLAAVLAHPEWPISYDVETAFMLGEKEPEDWRAKRLIQIQFSVRPGQAMVLPWDNGPYTQLARTIMASPNPKWGWNSARSDDIILAANGCPIAGERHDLMLAWAHLQPDFTAKGADDDRGNNDKGIPAKLMGLQSAASFYCPEVGPWKHLGAGNLQLYGAYDADYTTRCGIGIFRELDRLGLSAGYREHKYELRFALDDIGDYGLPVDRVKQADLRVYTLGELHRIQTAMHAEVPPEILSLHPATGYKALHSKVSLVDPAVDEEKWPKVPLKSILADYDADNPPLVMAAGKVGYLTYRVFEDVTKAGEAYTERRPCIERLYNPHASSPNTKAYIRYQGYKMPVNYLTGQDTTGLIELDKLAKETGDPILRGTYDWRKLRKTGLDYTTGKWVPGEDGRVHGTFRCGTTGSGQTSCTDPNAQQFPEHTGLAKRAKEAIRAEPGHIFVKIDMRGFHSRAIGWLANDPTYYQLADEDVHSFITAHFLNLPDAPYLMEMSPDERRAALKAVKAEHAHTRNYKVKRVVHGRQFNMGVKKLYQLHGADFDPPVDQAVQIIGEAKWYSLTPDQQVEAVNALGRKEANRLYRLFDSLFPMVFVVYLENVREQIYHITKNRLTTPFGHHRFFWNWDMEQAAAFRPSNCAHCVIQSALIRLRKRGALRAFGAANFTHDALWLHPRESDVEECIAVVQEEFERPSDVLVDSPLGPFFCNSDAEIGYDLAHMEPYERKR